MFRRRKRGTFLYTLLFIITLFVLHKFVVSFSDIYSYTYATITYPVLLSQKYIITPVKKFFEKRKNLQELQNLVFKLHKERENLVSENIHLRATLSFHNQTKEVLDFKKRYTSYNSNNSDISDNSDNSDSCSNFQLCHILFKHIDKNSHFIFINKGTLRGVCKDMVVVYKNFLLGKVIQVFPFYSKVLLITDKSCKVAAYCAKTKAHGIHRGANSQTDTLLTRVSHFENVLPDDMVLSSGYGLVFPQGFALGKITDVQSGDLYHTIKIKPLFDIKDINYCFLIQKGNY
ncbi:rod shape-determining protein MreC [Candidatus Dependentiae bacterium]